MLDQIGGADKFNTGEIEKSIINMYGHLQGHVQRGVNDLENLTNSLLRQKTDVGAFIRGEGGFGGPSGPPAETLPAARTDFQSPSPSTSCWR